jgi:hypothetical protein
MSAKLFILMTLLVSLLAAPFAQQATAQAPVKMPGCAKMNCVRGCCAVMPCCVKSQESEPQPVRAPLPPRADVQFAALEFPTLSLLYTLPPPLRTFVVVDEVRAVHSLPPLATSCIQLI